MAKLNSQKSKGDKVTFTELEVRNLLNATIERLGRRAQVSGAEEISELGKQVQGGGKYYAACGAGHGIVNSWFGPCRGSASEARKDSNAHNAQYAPPHHAGVIGPTICTD